MHIIPPFGDKSPIPSAALQDCNGKIVFPVDLQDVRALALAHIAYLKATREFNKLNTAQTAAALAAAQFALVQHAIDIAADYEIEAMQTEQEILRHA